TSALDPPVFLVGGGRFRALDRGGWGWVGWACLVLGGLDQGEEDGLADAQAREGHQEAVQAHTHAAARGHRVLHGREEVLVEHHGLVVTSSREPGLRLEALALDDRV